MVDVTVRRALVVSCTVLGIFVLTAGRLSSGPEAGASGGPAVVFPLFTLCTLAAALLLGLGARLAPGPARRRVRS